MKAESNLDSMICLFIGVGLVKSRSIVNMDTSTVNEFEIRASKPILFGRALR